MKVDITNDSKRRNFLHTATGAGLMATLAPVALTGKLVTGSDAPEKREVRIGFIPLTDCAPVVMAAEQGFDKKYGIRIVPTREASWATIRDKLIHGELDAAHVLYGLVYGVQTGIGGPKKDMNILMALNNNGQAITLSRQLLAAGIADGAGLAASVARQEKGHVFAQTFPTGTHAMLMYYWLAALGIDPFQDVRDVTVPPPQMVANMRAGNIDGFCAGEPWNHRAIADGIGFTVATSQEIWPDHPEKVLGASAEWVDAHPNTARALTAALLEAGRWIDTAEDNRRLTARTIAREEYVNVRADLIVERMLGRYDNGLGRIWQEKRHLKFFADGAVNFPWLSDGMWFLTQHKRWGLLKGEVDYLALARKVHRIDIYRDAAVAAGVALPTSEMRSSRLMDGATWDGTNPRQYATSFSIHANPNLLIPHEVT